MLDRIFSRTGPEMPPDVVVEETPPRPPVIDEPTDKFFVLPSPPPPRFAARAVIVYEQTQRRPWRLWAFTAVLVALTIGVVLGQAEAFQPVSRGQTAQAAVVPSVATPFAVSPTPVATVTAPLGKVRARLIEVTGVANVLRVTSANLGNDLYRVTPLDNSATPRTADTKTGTHLDLVRTGAPGTVGAEIRLNAKVAWTVRLTGTSSDREIDMRAGGLAALDVTGTTARVALQLPQPQATVRIKLSAPVSELIVRSVKTAPVRLRLGSGADLAVVGGKSHRKVKRNTTLTEPAWKTAKTRYDVATTAPVGTASVLNP